MPTFDSDKAARYRRLRHHARRHDRDSQHQRALHRRRDAHASSSSFPHFHVAAPRRVLGARGGDAAACTRSRSNGDVTFDDVSAGRSRVIADGRRRVSGAAVRATNLRVQMLPVQVDMARTWMPSLPIGGVVTGTVTFERIDGHARLAALGNVDHRDRGTRSVARWHGDGSALRADSGSTSTSWRNRCRSSKSDASFRGRAARNRGRADPSHRLAARPARARRSASAGRRTSLDARHVRSREPREGLRLLGVTLHAQSAHDHEQGAVTSLTAQRHGARPRIRSADDAIDDRVRTSSTSRWDSIARRHAVGARDVGNGLADVQRLYARGRAHGGDGVGHLRARARPKRAAHVSRRRRFARRVQSAGFRKSPASRRRRWRRGRRVIARAIQRAQGRFGAHRARDGDGAA